VTIDWLLLGDGTLDDTQALATAIIVALGTDRLALPDDILPDPDSSDRKGWWGDFDAGPIWKGWPIGTRLWLESRDKIVGQDAEQGSTEMRIREYIEEALQPFVDNRICTLFDVQTQRNGRERIDVLIRMYRGPLAAIELQFQVLWSGMVQAGGTYDIGTPLNPL
jgi:phage gp46-like protein